LLNEQKNLKELVAIIQLKQQPPVLDIEEWKQLFNNQLFQIICDQLPIGISICIDPSCREIRHNTVAAGFFRINAWDNLSHSSPDIPTFKMFMNDTEMLPEEMPIQRSMRSGQTIKAHEVFLLWEDGIKKIIVFNSRPLFDANGKVIGAVATSEDITERKRREQERENLLQEIDRERARSQAIIEALPVGLFLTDAQGKLLLVNDVAYDVCGGEVYFASDASDYSFYKCWWTDTGEKLTPEDFPLIRSLKGEIYKNATIDFERLNGYSITSRHGARITVDTSPGGTTFFTRFPLPSSNVMV